MREGTRLLADVHSARAAVEEKGDLSSFSELEMKGSAGKQGVHGDGTAGRVVVTGAAGCAQRSGL